MQVSPELQAILDGNDSTSSTPSDDGIHFTNEDDLERILREADDDDDDEEEEDNLLDVRRKYSLTLKSSRSKWNHHNDNLSGSVHTFDSTSVNISGRNNDSDNDVLFNSSSLLIAEDEEVNDEAFCPITECVGNNTSFPPKKKRITDLPRLHIPNDQGKLAGVVPISREEPDHSSLENLEVIAATDDYDDDDDDDDDNYENHSAVLQAILNEHDDDDDDDDNDEYGNYYTDAPPKRSVSVESILHSMKGTNTSSHNLFIEGDDDDDDDDDDEDPVLVDFDNLVSSYQKQDRLVISPVSITKTMAPPPTTVTTNPDTKTTNVVVPTYTAGTTTRPIKTKFSFFSSQDFTESALNRAREYERNLLRPGQTDIVSPLMVKRRRIPRVPLKQQNSASVQQQLQQQHAMVECKNMNKISMELKKNMQVRQKAVGLPTCLTMNSKFIAIGTQRGIVLVFDLFEELRQQLSIQKENVMVTCMDLSWDGETLVAGYSNGSMLLWDVIQGCILKSMDTTSSAETAPITCLKFVKAAERVVSVDASGLVNKYTFSKSMLWTQTMTVETECLLDGSAGQILALSVLPPYPGYDWTLLALTSSRSSFVVAVEPTISVLHKWAKPPSNDEGTDNNTISHLPCLSWGWSLVMGGGHVPIPILARSWQCHVQFLHANSPAKEADSEDNNTIVWPAFGVLEDFQVTSAVVAMEWLGPRALIYLTDNNEVSVIDTVMMTLTEKLDFSSVTLVYAEFALAASATVCTSFQNSMHSLGDNLLLILCQEEVKSISILGIQQRIKALEEDGEWLEALALALDHYESTVATQQDKMKKSFLDKNKPWLLSNNSREEEEWMVELLMRYLQLAMDNAPVMQSSQQLSLKNKNPNKLIKIDLAESHFQMLAGVCMEYCVVTQRLDVLYQQIYSQFEFHKKTHVFFTVLEPYLLHDKLCYVAPTVMPALIEHCQKQKGDISTVERCLLHMDVTMMDFNTIIPLLIKHHMFSALFHVYTVGLNDYVTPLERLLEVIISSSNSSERDSYGYKIFLYLQHCFTGKSFPQNEEIPPIISPLLHFFYNEPSYLQTLILVDPKALLDTLSMAFDSPHANFIESNDYQTTIPDWHSTATANAKAIENNDHENQSCPDRQRIATVLSMAITEIEDNNERDQKMIVVRTVFLEFLAKYLLKGVVRTPQSLTLSILKQQKSQEKVIELLHVLPSHMYDLKEVLQAVKNTKMSRAALFLHKAALQQDDDQSHFLEAIHCYLQDSKEVFQEEVFDYIKNECILHNTLESADDDDYYQKAVLDQLPGLVTLNAVRSSQLVAELYMEELDSVWKVLEKNDLSLFHFVRAILSGDLTRIDSVLGPVLMAQLTTQHHQRYLELMAQFHPEMVYQHVITHDNYRTEECLQLCQRYEIADASAYLLERMGNVNSALQLLLQTLEGRLMTLKRIIRGLVVTNTASNHSRYRSHRKQRKQSDHQTVRDQHEVEIKGVEQLLIVGLDICERNSSGSSSAVIKTEHGSQLWFHILDRLINAKAFLRLSKELPHHSKVMLKVLSELLQLTMQRMVSNVPLQDLLHKITTDHAGNLLGEFREMIVTMLKTYSSQLELRACAVELMNHDTRQMSLQTYHLKVCGSRAAFVGQPRPKQNQNLVYSVHPKRSLIPTKPSPLSFEDIPTADDRNIVTTTAMRVSRLRSKRQQRSFANSARSKQMTSLNMLTSDDHLFLRGESSDAAFLPRAVGQLPGAEHYGSLR